VYAVFGEEAFLRRQAVHKICDVVLGDDDPELATTMLDGAVAQLADVLDELATLPLLTPHRLVVVDPAEPFVASADNRTELEDYLGHPASTGTLLLAATKWNKSTRLHKRVDKVGCAVECKPLRDRDMAGWLVRHAQKAYGKKLGSSVARMLVDLVGQEMGQADSELQKLAAYVGDRAQITEQDLDAVAGGSRLRTSWQLMDAVADGHTGNALGILDRLLLAGDAPVAILAAMAWQLRRMVRASHLLAAGQPGSGVCRDLGVPPFAADAFTRRVRRLGQERLEAGYRGLLEADLELKGQSQLSPRAVVERWIIRLAG
jgi:DNA polymerase III subunit delta